MNGYQMHADSYKKLLENTETAQEVQEDIKKKIKAFEIMANTDRQTQCELFNSGAFNDVCKGYLLSALDRCGIDHDTAQKIMSTVNFEEFDAAEAEAYYRTH